MGNNAVTWWELPATDLAAAQKFYGDVLGWQFAPMGEGYVLVSTSDGTPIGGLTQEPPQGARLYAEVDDLEDTIARAVAAGGKVVQERKLISEEFGWWGLIHDANGQEFGLWTHNAPKS